MNLHGKGPAMLQPQQRIGVHAWDERDARSIASNTPSYGSALFRMHSRLGPVPEPANPMPSATSRLASAVMARIRLRSRGAALRG
jgi:hypothetical protein